MAEPVPVLISACLLGEKVRYDGGHKLAPDLLEAFGSAVRWIPVCPEVGCGLSVPREPMTLKGDPTEPRLAGVDTGTDYTDRMMRWMKIRLRELEPLGLCGYVCKKNSPSCSGIGRIGVVGESGAVTGFGSGVFTKAFSERFPGVPIAEEEQLKNPAGRESFLEKAFARRRAGSADRG